MANSESKKQTDHDGVVYAAKNIYEEHGLAGTYEQKGKICNCPCIKLRKDY